MTFIIHCPNYENNNQLENVFPIKRRKYNNQFFENVDILTWNNSNEESILEKSLHILGMKCEVLGKSIQNWSNRLKINLTYDFLEKSKKPYVLGVDAFDAIFIDYPRYMNHDMIFNATPGSFPFKKEFDLYEESITNSSIFCHFNAGVWFGKREMCLRFFKDALNYKDNFTEQYPDSEQVVLRSILPNHKYVELDDKCRYFQIINDFKELDQYLQIQYKMFN